MNYRTTIAAGALTALLSLPAGAAAHEQPSPQSVAKHLRGADGALELVESLVERDSDAKAAVRLARFERQMRAADREARTLRREANSGREKVRSGRALVKVARGHDEGADTLADIADETDGELEVKVADVARSELRGRKRALAILTRLLDELPEAARKGIETAIKSVSRGDERKAEDVNEAPERGGPSDESAAPVTGPPGGIPGAPPSGGRPE